VRDCVQLVLYLYHRYIAEDSVLTVNISGSNRNQIKMAYLKHRIVDEAAAADSRPSLVFRSDSSYRREQRDMASLEIELGEFERRNGNNEVDIKQLLIDIMTEMDVARDELYHLLQMDSFPRFKHSEEYRSAITLEP